MNGGNYRVFRNCMRCSPTKWNEIFEGVIVLKKNIMSFKLLHLCFYQKVWSLVITFVPINCVLIYSYCTVRSWKKKVLPHCICKQKFAISSSVTRNRMKNFNIKFRAGVTTGNLRCGKLVQSITRTPKKTQLVFEVYTLLYEALG